ncbi:hypothetical protein C8F01DRAFT_1170411 [Mycena amicta]|nr:hypothetical protein C8F01DRAFT_1170411 [Mycena amicta]
MVLPPGDPPPPHSALSMQVVIVVVETFAFAAFLVLFFAMKYLRTFSPPERRPGLNFVNLSSLAILALATAHWAIMTTVFFSAMFSGTDSNTTLGDILLDGYFGRLQNALTIGNALSFVAMLLGDAILIHRLSTIYDSYIVAIPAALCWLGVLITGIMVEVILAQHLPKGLPFRWITANWSFSTLTTVYCTSFMAYRIWKTIRRTQKMKARMFMSILIVLVESAAIWAAWTLFFIILHITHSELQVLGTALVPSVIGIANALIYIRVAFSDGWGPGREATTRRLTLTNPASFAITSVSSEGRSDYGYEYASRKGGAIDDRQRAEYGDEYRVEYPPIALAYGNKPK